MKKGLKILLAADGFILFAFGLLTPIYAIFVEEIGGNVLDAGITYSIYLFVLGIATYFIGKWENHQKHKEKILIFSYALFCLASIGYLLVSNKIHLFIVQAVLGLAGAFNSPVFDGLYSRFLSKGEFVSQWGIYSSMESIVTAIAALSGGAIAFYAGFKTLFTIMFILSLMGLFVSIRLRKLKK